LRYALPPRSVSRSAYQVRLPVHLTCGYFIQIQSAPLALLILGPTPAARAHTMDALLEPLSVQACNAHLVVVILDIMFLALFPELGGGGEADPEGWREAATTDLTPPRSRS